MRAQGCLGQWARRIEAWARACDIPVALVPLSEYVHELFCEMRIDGQRVLFGFSDGGVLNQPHRWDMTLVVAAQPWHEHYLRLCPFPTPGWQTWEEYLDHQDYVSQGDKIMARMFYGDARVGRTLRRERLQVQLVERFGEQVMTTRTPRSQHLVDLAQSRMVVHSGGAFANSWDRTTAEAFSLGKVLIQPEIHVLVGATRPIRDIHYLACRDDTADAADLVQWVLDHPDQAAQIGESAQQFFLQNLSPKATWLRVRHRLTVCVAERAAMLAAQQGK